MPSLLMASEPAIIDYNDRFHPVVSENGMVVSQEALASRIGADILAAGGNAIDAAVATGFALAVTLPQAGNIGGGGFMMIYLADEQRTLAVDYREMASLSAHRDLFLDKDGEVDEKKARYSRYSAGIPGTVAGLIYALNHYGSMSLNDVLKPAIHLADTGIRVTRPLAFSLARAEQRLKKSTASTRYYFLKDGSPLPQGHLWQQRDLANTLRKIATTNGDAFYKGDIARQIVAEMQAQKGATESHPPGNEQERGLISAEDLAAYRVVEREVVTGEYRGYQIAAMPPPSSGGVHLVQMLNILEGWELQGLGHNSADYLHRLIEAMRRAYADRSEYLGDPDFNPVPVARLTDKNYAARLRDAIDLQKATPSSDIKPGLELPEESPQTTHYSVWDKQGNVVSNTYTLNFSYGSGIAVSGAGFLLNNEMDDFSAKLGVPNAYGLVGGEANAIEPRKRPLSSMTPVIIFKDGKPVLTTGSPGGSTIINTVLQTVLNVVDFDMNIAEAAAQARIHHQWLPDKVFYEADINRDTRKRLESMGHTLQASPRVIGRTQTISSDGNIIYGANDTRWPGGEAAGL
ncbi:MAG: gamma-glutamyltransferase [Cellvibrionales bacterium]|nr:MAG: gamma-glutamyltransferase [Cellvibrionales bacterium]